MATRRLGLDLIPPTPYWQEIIENANNAFSRIDGFLLNSVVATTNTPPASPLVGQMYLIGTSPTGIWVGKAGQLAYYDGSEWDYYSPPNGTVVYDQNSTALNLLSSGTWGAAAIGGGSSAASAITFTPAGDLVAANVQAALQELDGEKLAIANIDDAPVNGETSAPISSNWAFDHAAAANPHSTSLADVSDQITDQAQQILHGFPNRTATTLSFNDTSHVVTLGVATTATVYINGVAYTLSSPGLTIDLDTKTLSNGLWYIWAEVSTGAAVLNAAKSVWDIVGLTAIPVATVYWNGSAGALSDERHGATRNLALHKYLHKTVGARIQNDGSFAQTRPTTANDAHLELVAGSLWDEDIENAITTAQGKLCRLWYETAAATWTFVDGTDNGGYDRPFLWNAGTSRVRFPESDNSYTLADGSNSNYIPVWVYATNDVARPIYIVTPALTAGYSNVANARLATVPTVPFAEESKLLYRWIYRGDGEYQEAADYRTSSSLPSGGVVNPNAVSVAFSPSGNLSSTNVQAAIEELDTEKLAGSEVNYLAAIMIATSFGAMI